MFILLFFYQRHNLILHEYFKVITVMDKNIQKIIDREHKLDDLYNVTGIPHFF